MKHFIPYASQQIDQDDIDAVAEALRQPQITRGETVEAFEEQVADYVGAPYAVAFNSGSSALNAAAFALDLGPQDRIISTANTFISTLGCAVQRGASPVFVDIDPTTGLWNDEAALLNLQVERSRGKDILMPVHFTGATTNIELLESGLAKESAFIIEDAAHALGSSYSDGVKVGASHLSEMTILSFHPAKTITTGEGGMVTTQSEELYQLLKLARNNGIFTDDYLYPGFYDVLDLSCNYHMTAFQAALGISQLKKIDAFVAKRRSLVKYYREKLKGIKEIIPLADTQDDRSAHHIFVVQIDFEALRKTRNGVMEFLKSKGIGTQVHYIPVYRHSVFSVNMENIEQYFPGTETYFAKALTLPLYTKLEKEDIDYIVASLKEALSL